MDDVAAPTPQPESPAPLPAASIAPAQLPPPAPSAATQAAEPRYEGNSYDLYALIAGIVGITFLGLCFSGNMLFYCLPFVPLVFGIIALRNSSRSLNPSRTRTMGWIGIAAGAVGLLIILVFALFFAVYLAFIFSFMGEIIRNMPRRP